MSANLNTTLVEAAVAVTTTPQTIVNIDADVRRAAESYLTELFKQMTSVPPR